MPWKGVPLIGKSLRKLADQSEPELRPLFPGLAGGIWPFAVPSRGASSNFCAPLPQAADRDKQRALRPGQRHILSHPKCQLTNHLQHRAAPTLLPIMYGDLGNKLVELLRLLLSGFPGLD